MPLKGHATYYRQDGQGHLIISSKVADDSAFPFVHKERLKVEIEPSLKRVIVTKKEETEESGQEG